MDKLKFETKSGAERNIEQIAKLFPEVITEAVDTEKSTLEKKVYKKVVNFDTLKALLSGIVEGRAESYDFTWVGKREAMIEAGTPIRKTLRPVRIDETVPSGADSEGKPYCSSGSVNWDTTQNLYIEGDNLDVLKLLTDSYHGKVKMIYIDPPYNTGKDFVYKDNFTMSKNDYEEGTERVDEDGNVNYKENLATNPRFHSDWCSMIYPRLKVARNLLTQDGVIFISIDDNEVHNIRKICDEIFGAVNFVACITWERSYAPINLKKHFSESHDFILCYAKYIDFLVCNGLPRSDSTNAKYGNPDNDPRGLWRTDNLSVGPVIAEKVYEITTPSGRKVLPPKGRCWVYTRARYEEMVADNRIWFGENGDNVPAPKRFLSEVKQGLTPMTIWKYTEVGHNQDSMRELRELFDGEKVFDYSKPVKLIKQILSLYSGANDIILDFFSGSATTAHAVMQLNAEDNGNRKFIMVQLSEATDEKGEAYKAGFKNICEIGKERIRRAGQKIADKNAMLYPNLDVGFRVFKLDESNFKDVHFSAGQVAQMSSFDTLAENLKEDRTAEDLLYSCILEWGLPLTLTHTEETIEGKKVFVVNGGDLIACFESELPESVIKAIAARKPLNALFRESCFIDSPAKINNEEIFKLISPSTKVKVL